MVVELVVFGMLPLMRRQAPIIEDLRRRLGLTPEEMAQLREKAETASALLTVLVAMLFLRDRTEERGVIQLGVTS